MSATRAYVDGRPVWVPDADPWTDLTPWQRTCAHAVLARQGNRTRAARDLGVSTTTVQQTVERLARKGLVLPVGKRRGPDLRPRKGTRPPCGEAIRGGACGRGTGHAGAHRTEAYIIRARAANARYDARRRAA